MTIDAIELVLDRLEQEIRDHDADTIRWRWEFGRLALSDTELTDQDGQLKHDAADALIAELAEGGAKVSLREIEYRVQCAQTYRTEAQIRVACAQFGNWRNLINAGFPPAHEA